MTAKQLIQEVLASTPDDAPLNDVLYRILARETVERGLSEADAGQTISHAEIKRRIAGWITSHGGRR